MRSIRHSGLNSQEVAPALVGTDVNVVFRSFDLQPQGAKGEMVSLIYRVVALRKLPEASESPSAQQCTEDHGLHQMVLHGGWGQGRC